MFTTSLQVPTTTSKRTCPDSAAPSECTITPGAKRPKRADDVAAALALTPPPVVGPQTVAEFVNHCVIESGFSPNNSSNIRFHHLKKKLT